MLPPIADSRDRLWSSARQTEVSVKGCDSLLTAIGTVGGLVGLTVSVLLLALQTREVARQTRISNTLARASILDQYMVGLREVMGYLVDQPELRPYFYEGRALPARGRKRRQIITIAELLADVLEAAMVAVDVTVESASTDPNAPWTPYGKSMLRDSPAFTQVVRSQPDYWPRLNALANTTANDAIDV